MLIDPSCIEQLISQATPQIGLSAFERIHQLGSDEQAYLSFWAILSESLSEDDVQTFLAICGFPLDEQNLVWFLEAGLTHYVATTDLVDGKPVPLFKLEQGVRKHLINGLSAEQITQRHELADKYYRSIFAQVLRSFLATELSAEETSLLTDEALEQLIVQPGGLIDVGAHTPQQKIFHTWSVVRAAYWQEHLFALGKVEMAAHIANSICFTLARTGHRQLAKDMLARTAMLTTGATRAVALTNLATLFREEQEHQSALRLYRQVMWPLFWHRAYPQLAGVFSETSNIHRDRGQIWRALTYQQLSNVMRIVLNDAKGRAICNNQLSILYRSRRLYRLALHCSRSAERYWRSTRDDINLAKTLITQGNLLNVMKQPQAALTCFEESLVINTELNNQGEAASSLAGKARASLQLRDFEQTKVFLEEAIALRKRTNDHRLGIEYENMGELYEAQGNLPLALGWYEKALPLLEKYQPGLAAPCSRKINSLQKMRK